jgi:beta-phosphoglucomutase-like phosphatase (HAD superfamily)
MIQALIFDVDGTLADTESAHLAAFNHAFAEMGMGWVWDEALYTGLLDISGGKERILHYWKTTCPNMLEVDAMALSDTVNRLHELKTAAYEAAVNGGAVSLRPGVLKLMDEARAQGLQLAIATTTSPVNIAALMRRAIGSDWRLNFTAIGDASTAPIKKPHPRCICRCWQRSISVQRIASRSKTPATGCAQPPQPVWPRSSLRPPTPRTTTLAPRCALCPI